MGGEANLFGGIAVFPKGWERINGKVARGSGFNIGAEVPVKRGAVVEEFEATVDHWGWL